MSLFYCNRCHNLCDSDDGAYEDPSNPLECVCVDCGADLEEEQEQDEPQWEL